MGAGGGPGCCTAPSERGGREVRDPHRPWLSFPRAAREPGERGDALPLVGGLAGGRLRSCAAAPRSALRAVHSDKHITGYSPVGACELRRIMRIETWP